MNADEKSVAGAFVRVNAFFVYRRLTGDIQVVLVVENRDMSKRHPVNVVIRDDYGKRKAVTLINNLKLFEGERLEVVIRPYKETRSQQQHKLYWKWITIIADETGHSKDQMHEQLKRRFLLPILEREDAQFGQIMANLRKAWRDGHKELAEQLNAAVVLNASTTVLSVGSMTEYLNSVKDFADEHDIQVPIPERKNF